MITYVLQRLNGIAVLTVVWLIFFTAEPAIGFIRKKWQFFNAAAMSEPEAKEGTFGIIVFS